MNNQTRHTLLRITSVLDLYKNYHTLADAAYDKYISMLQFKRKTELRKKYADKQLKWERYIKEVVFARFKLTEPWCMLQFTKHANDDPILYSLYATKKAPLTTLLFVNPHNFNCADEHTEQHLLTNVLDFISELGDITKLMNPFYEQFISPTYIEHPDDHIITLHQL